MTTYSTPLFIKEISPTTLTTTLTTTTTTTITPTPAIHVAKIYPYSLYVWGEADIIDAEIYYGFRLKPPPAGYKYFIFSNLSLTYFSPFVGPFAWSCNYAIICDPWGRCEEDYICDWIEFYEYNSTHTYTFTTSSCQDLFYIAVRYYPWEEDKIRNAWMVIAVVEENATLEDIMRNLHIA
jgi:hypothetical protein